MNKIKKNKNIKDTREKKEIRMTLRSDFRFFVLVVFKFTAFNLRPSGNQL
jgi:hypothetical protein